VKIPTYLRIAALVATVAVTAGACGGGGKSHNAKPAAAVATTLAPTTSTSTVESKILADLAAYEDAFHQALANPDAPPSALAAHLTGKDLGVTLGYVAQLKDAHQSIRGPITNKSVRLVTAEPARAVVEVCAQNDSHTYQNGVQQPDSPGDRLIGSEFTMVLEQGTWKVFNVASKASLCAG